jgi:hypothetical protein
MMTSEFYYFSVQYSAIQKTILRHDRLWSVTGISMILSELNEIGFPRVVSENNGTVLVAGGGKFTARFSGERDAETAKRDIVKILSTTLPMLEFQASKEIIRAESMNDAKAEKKDKDGNILYPGLIRELSEQKRHFRGYGVSFNPHLKTCDECGEYPVAAGKKIPPGDKRVCGICCSS